MTRLTSPTPPDFKAYLTAEKSHQERHQVIVFCVTSVRREQVQVHAIQSTHCLKSSSMVVSQAIRYVPATKTALGALYINCHVKPNARQRSEILSVDEEVVDLAVSAQARKGEANKAVVGLLASVSCIL